MDPPVCRICGKKHWSRVCGQEDVRGQEEAPVQGQEPRPRTPKLVAPSELKAAQGEIEALRAEVVELKRELAQRECPTCRERRSRDAERKRGSRTKS
jgi:hypothetical protein